MFGGAVAATIVRAARLTLGIELPLSDAHFTFLAPTPAGSATVRVTPLRRGRRFADAVATVESRGVTTAQASLSFSPTPPSLASRDAPRAAVEFPRSHVSFDGAIEWQPARPTRAGVILSRIRARGGASTLQPDEWACIAADLIGPGALTPDRGPFAVATATLAISLIETAAPAEWWHQHLTTRASDDLADGILDLTSADGRLLARAHQRAALLPAEAHEMPQSATAFANSSLDSLMIGMN
ncbi:hypothetical protein GCM10009808_11370 [Microbacterium sediminicola]|uniref:Acyl-CoA thioesterase-like N-terminal HotDog domain-containing protein n=2 Tax=Microbacterium sediminicola TaxID=415210 RepID=A0ABP4U051_9MICO